MSAGGAGTPRCPAIADNALVKATRYIDALAQYAPERTLIPEVEAFLELVLGERPPAELAVERARAVDPLAAELIEPLLSLTLAPTMIRASERTNVIPALCEVTVDCRLLPGQTPRDVEPLIRAALGDGDWEHEWIEPGGGTRSPLDTPLWSALESFVQRIEPGARLAPLCSSGFTDSHWLRSHLGTVAYGFFPMRAMPADVAARLVHSANERIPVDDLELAVEAFRHVALELS